MIQKATELLDEKVKSANLEKSVKFEIKNEGVLLIEKTVRRVVFPH